MRFELFGNLDGGEMQRETLEKLIKAHKSIAKIARAKSVSCSTIRYWLKRHELKTEGVPFYNRPPKPKPLCADCGQPVKRRPNVYCSLGCAQRFKRRIKVETNPDAVGHRLLKSYLLDTRGHR